ncbi:MULTISPECIES: DUF485 domain-containing protein [unclassified Streptomyces]|uniref:DUF485 domain-containing protein n=1 Tax=unclassified Streptomyces TaxID=2593676 RepID=UPI002258598B|nr:MULTISPECIES: DUF485 domain-containing protein [unclassified Streptomyces]MCX4534634.1 DUF485 domain-containing protein [Streptomyces sp. NBC_01669]WSA00026.1 DUF485 domain-containing protein [Streptomyces sp. NBC_00841]
MSYEPPHASPSQPPRRPPYPPRHERPQPSHRPQYQPPQDPGFLLPWQRSAPAAPPRWPSPPVTPVPAPGHHSDLRRLRAAYRVLRRGATLTALGFFTLFLLLSGFAPGLMTHPLGGGLTTGLALGLCQLPVTLLAIALYERTARRVVDPLSAELRRTGAVR